MTDGAKVLDLKLPENDAGAADVRDYLKRLLQELFEEGEGFSGKRPFGNSGWEDELAEPLAAAGLLVTDWTYSEFRDVIFEAIALL